MATVTGPPRQRKPVPVRRQHLAAVLDSCGIATVGVYLTAAVCTLTGVRWWVPAAVAVVAGILSVLVAGVATANADLELCLSAWTVILAGWLGYAMLTSSYWSWATAGALGGPAAVMTAVSVIVWARHTDETRKAEKAVADREAAEQHRKATAKLDRYAQILARLGCEGCQAVGEQAAPGGRTVTIVLPATGRVTLSRLKQIADGVAVALRLPYGAVAFRDGQPGQAEMWLNERDILADDVPFPEDGRMLTINEPLELGIDAATGDPARVLFRGVAAYTIGMTGSGKTTLMHVKIARWAMCKDTIIVVIDLKGGRLAAPWIRAWVEERAHAPAVSWVATTRDEAWTMLTAILDVITMRGESLAGGSKIKPSAQCPQFIIVGDEIADIFGQLTGKAARAPEGGHSNDEMAHIGSAITRKQRSEACMPDWATQRGTVTMAGPGDIKSQCGLKFALNTATEADARAIIPDDAGAARLLAALSHPGSMLVTLPGVRAPLPVKVYRLDPDEDEHPEDIAKLDRISVRAGNIRPEPEPAAVAVMGERWTNRWERSRLYQVMRAEFEGLPLDQLAPDGALPAGPAGDAAEFEQVLAQAGEPVTSVRDPKARMFALLADFPRLGISVAEISARLAREQMTVRRETVHRWLEAEIRAGKVERVGEKGTVGARYRYRQR